jgi:hypothetical protein
VRGHGHDAEFRVSDHCLGSRIRVEMPKVVFVGLWPAHQLSPRWEKFNCHNSAIGKSKKSVGIYLSWSDLGHLAERDGRAE